MRRLVYLCSALAAVTAAGAARAEGPYIAADAGASFQHPLNYNFVGLSDFFSTKYSVGVSASGKLGYDFEGIRVEAELGYRRAPLNEFGFQINGQPLAVQRGAGVTGSLNSFSAMVNGYWDFTQGRFRPYVGGGVGIAHVTSDRVGYSGAGDNGIFLDTSDTAFALQLMAGVSGGITKHLSATLEYRYFDVPKYKLGVFNSTASASVHSSTIAAGVRYSFGHSLSETTPPPRPPAVAPVAETAPLGTFVPVGPAPAAAAAPVGQLPVQTIFSLSFKPHSAVLPVDAAATLAGIVTAYKQAGHASVMLVSSAAEDGLVAYDETLAHRRAATLALALTRRGVPRAALDVDRSEAPVANTAAAGDRAPRPTVEISFGPGSGQ